METFDCVVIGSGINSLVCAALLAKKGRRVCVLERNDRLGGCIRTEALTVPGFTHDVLSGFYPLFVTSPAYPLLKDDLAAQGVVFDNTDTPTGVLLPDGRHMVLSTSRAQNGALFDSLAAGDGARYGESLATLEREAHLTFGMLGNEVCSWPVAKLLATELWKNGLKGLLSYFGRSMDSARDWLETTFQSDLARACFAPWILHTGLGTESSLSGHMNRLIAFTLEAAGLPVVRGGSARLVEAFQRIIEAHGGVLHVNTDVARIVVENGVANGVETADGRRFGASRAVIGNVTPTQLYGRLLDPAAVPDEVARDAAAYRYGRADMQIHLALDGPVGWADAALAKVGMLHLSSGLDGVSRAVNEAECGLLPQAATIVVAQPTAIDPSRAPAGKSILWLQLQELPRVIRGDAAGEIAVPANGAWTEAVREQYADRIIARLEHHLPGLRERILKRVVLSPADLQRMNINLVGGDPYSGSCAAAQFLAWRPLRSGSGHATVVKHLYQIGASTHPGPGLGGVSGFLVAQRL